MGSKQRETIRSNASESAKRFSNEKFEISFNKAFSVLL